MKKIVLLLSLAALLIGTVQAHAYAGQRLYCESVNYRDAFCPVSTRHGVELVRQLSRSACVQGRTWGYNHRGIWVSNGCAAEFVVFSGRGERHRPGPPGAGPPGVRPPYAPHNPLVIACESHRYGYNYCPVSIHREVRLVRSHSRSPCRYGHSWGYDRRGIWVDAGCRGEFAIY